MPLAAINRFVIPVLLMLLAMAAVSCSSAAPDMEALYGFEGTYETEPGHRVTIGISDEFGHALMWLDLKTLAVGLLEPVSAGRFRDVNDASLSFAFEAGSGGVDVLVLTRGTDVSRAPRVEPHRREAVAFTSEGRTLRGNLYLPAAAGRHPVVVFAHGSGPSTRGVGPFTTFFLQRGIGVLSFDKQGAGESEGDWRTAGFDSLAADVLAGVAFLKARPEVDASRIGISGSSQGGWIGSMAAASSPDVAFLLVRVGAGQSVRDTMAHEKRGQFMAEGITDAASLDEGVALYHAHWDVAARGGSWEEGQAVFDAYSDRPWFRQVFGDEPVEKTDSAERWWTWLGRNLGHDSVDHLKRVTVPVFWALAEKDWNVDSQASLPRINEALALAGNTDYTVRILPGAGHTGLMVETGLPNEAPSWRYAPGYWDGMADWLTQRGIGH